MNDRLVIAVDGPAASGKGTLAARLAAHFGLPHLDTGCLYRAVGKKTLEAKQARSVPENALTETDAPLAIKAAETLNLADVCAHDLGSEWIGQAASIVSAIPEVRRLLLDYQRNFAAQGNGAVLDGRDIGTVICPDATIKLFITASAEVRAKRRYDQQTQFDTSANYEAILTAIRERDTRDTARSTAPLKAADDAITIDSSEMDADAVFKKALSLFASRK